MDLGYRGPGAVTAMTPRWLMHAGSG
jgi:hypothetical protein